MANKILIVDDSGTMRKVIRRTLEMAELGSTEFSEAGSGKEALELMSEQKIDLVLADINMPEMTGIEMIRHMQEDEKLKSIPAIVVSTESSTTRIQELKDQGVKGYVHKPFTPEKIREVVNEVLGVSHAGSQ